MIGFWILMLVGLILFSGLLYKSKDRSFWPLFLVAWVGSLLAVGSLFFLPWVTFGPPQTFEKNARWVLEKSNALELIENFPPLKDAFLARPRTPNDLRRWLTDPETVSLLDQAQAGHPLTGWHVALRSFQNTPLLGAALFAGGSAALILGLISLLQLGFGAAPNRAFSLAAAGLCLAAIIILFNQISFLDCLNRTSDFKLRLLAAFLQSNTGPGGWIFMTGLALAAGCAAAGSSPGKSRREPDWNDLSSYPESYTSI